ncbi:MAG: hypothetical protein IPQ16_00780 [Geobacteraceae bacterium]|nr:hypothetical protein [Geobacteraceae bacterium]
MRQSLLTVLAVISMATGPSASQDQPAPKEENCRTAIEAGLEQLRRTPPDLNSRDDEDRRKLLADMERLVETNRRAGVSECRTWTQMMGKAFNQ